MRKAQGYEKGHGIYHDGECWRYTDNNEKEENNERPCKNCGRFSTKDGHDTCIANLPGVKYACCGHGDREQAYIAFENGQVVRGFTIQKAKLGKGEQ